MNRHLLTEGIDWWPSEVILDEHVATTIAGGHAEVMLTHDSPGPPYCTAPVADTIRTNPWGWPDASLAYAREGIETLTRAVLGVRPLLLAHGHTSGARPPYDFPALLTRRRSGHWPPTRTRATSGCSTSTP